MEVCHFPDKNRANNCVENLRWDTSKANQQDKIIHGTTTRGTRVNPGESNGMAKLTEEEVRQIRERWLTGKYRQVDLCKMSGKSAERIHSIVKGKAWK